MKNMLYTSKISHIKDISQRNDAFNQLVDEDKRREIALDVLHLLKTRTISSSIGFYWDNDLKSLASENSKIFQENLINISENQKCEVCARGAVMLSTIRLGNEICKTGADEIYSRGEDAIVKGFTMVEMKDMEEVYEDGDYFSPELHEVFKQPYMDNTDSIMKNIMLNVLYNGKFVPTDITDYLTEHPEYI